MVPAYVLEPHIRWSRLNSSIIGSLRIISSFFFSLSSRSLALSFPIALAMSVTSVREEKCERLNVVHFVQWYVFGEPLKRRLFICLFLSRWNVHVCLCYWERDKEKELMLQQVCGRLLWISGRFDDNLTGAERTWKQILWCWLSTKDFCHIQIAVYPLLSVPLLVTVSPFLSFLHLFLKYSLVFLFCFVFFLYVLHCWVNRYLLGLSYAAKSTRTGS